MIRCDSITPATVHNSSLLLLLSFLNRTSDTRGQGGVLHIYLKTNVDEDSRMPLDLIRTEPCFTEDIIEHG